MKKFFFFAAAIMAVACAKEAPRASVQDQVNVVAPSVDGVEAIAFGTNLKATVETKAQGSVGTWNATQNLYVYGFERKKNEDTQVVYLDYTTPKINNRLTTSPAQETSDAGDPLVTLKGSLDVKDENGQPYYYEGNKTYDFFGYYVDDLQVTPQTVEAGIYVPVTLTGGEDVMVATADPEVDGAALANPRYAYSAYAARRNVHPTLKFEHQLVQFTFNIKSGSDKAEEENLKVTALTLDALNSGDLYVAGETLGFQNVSAVPATLNLFGFEGYDVPAADPNAGPARIGDCIMVIPNTVNGPLAAEDTFSGKLYLTQEAMTEPAEVEFDLNFNEVQNVPVDDNGDPAISAFEAGYSFDITITVYSLEKIEISAELTEWKNGGKIEIDTDEEPEIF